MNTIIIAIILGIVEGLTEFIPVSSTGHLILAGHLLDFTGEKAETFEVFIQLGAILAVVVLYWNRFVSLLSFNMKKFNVLHVFIAMLPASILGLLLHDWIKSMFSPAMVIYPLVLGGILMIVAERMKVRVTATNLDELTYTQALQIGLFQCLSLWPGFSRSGSTIAGGIICGANHRTAADFTFIVAVPMMMAASGLDLLKSDSLTSSDIPMFAVGFISAFIVALLAIVTFLKILNKLKLTPFAFYRFILAAAVYFFMVK